MTAITLACGHLAREVGQRVAPTCLVCPHFRSEAKTAPSHAHACNELWVRAFCSRQQKSGIPVCPDGKKPVERFIIDYGMARLLHDVNARKRLLYEESGPAGRETVARRPIIYPDCRAYETWKEKPYQMPDLGCWPQKSLAAAPDTWAQVSSHFAPTVVDDYQATQAPGGVFRPMDYERFFHSFVNIAVERWTRSEGTKDYKKFVMDRGWGQFG